MRKSLTLFFAAFSVAASCLAKEQQVPTMRIFPENIVQGSIILFQSSTNHSMDAIKSFPITSTNVFAKSFAVRWTYTEAGAKKMLAFTKAHDGQEVITQVGTFESRGTIKPRKSYPPGWVNDDGWLKTRTDKFVGVTATDAKSIIAGLEGK